MCYSTAAAHLLNVFSLPAKVQLSGSRTAAWKETKNTLSCFTKNDESKDQWGFTLGLLQ